MILVVDFGGQYNQLIARRVRDLNVYCEVVPYQKALAKAKEINPKGIILQVDQTQYMKKMLQKLKKKYLN